MIIALLSIIIGALFALLLRQRFGSVTTSFLLTAVSILGYAGYTVYLGIILGSQPPWYYEGKFLVMPFKFLAVVGAAIAIGALAISTASIKTANDAGQKIRWRHLSSFGAASMATALLLLFIFFPVGLGVADQIAELRRSTWEVR